MAPKTATGTSLFPDDCDRPACDDIKAALPTSVAEIEAMKKRMAENGNRKVECPPKSSELGRSSWKLLHSMAAWYPDHPTTQQKERMTNFFQALADFYPCTWCAEDLQRNVEKTPVKAESRTDLCLWLCDQHNRVNHKLGKPLFRCDIENLDERWRKSSNPKCQSGNH